MIIGYSKYKQPKYGRSSHNKLQAQEKLKNNLVSSSTSTDRNLALNAYNNINYLKTLCSSSEGDIHDHTRSNRCGISPIIRFICTAMLSKQKLSNGMEFQLRKTKLLVTMKKIQNKKTTNKKTWQSCLFVILLFVLVFFFHLSSLLV